LIHTIITLFKKLFPQTPPTDEAIRYQPSPDSKQPEAASDNGRPDDAATATGGKSGKRTSGRTQQTSRVAKPQAPEVNPPPWDPTSFEVPALEGKTRFHDLDLPVEVMHAVADLKFEYCTPIQAEILPSTLLGKDASGRAQTGTGKTAAFLITVITRLLKAGDNKGAAPGAPRILILAPTRELVIQIANEARDLSKYTNLSTVTVFGGMDYEKQRRQLSGSPTDIVVATPGRLLDFNRHNDVNLKQVEVLIIDEADRMLDMGFIPDVRKIIYNTPHKSKRQTLLFSATLTPEVTRLSSQWTQDPVVVEIEPEQVAVDTVEQLVYIITKEDKYPLLYNIIMRQNLDRVIVFCNRKDETRRLADLFTRYGINCAVLSGDIPQQKRIRTLDSFKAGKIRMLVATDVAGRGIHIEGMDHVINYTLPHDPQDYVHRIGRTGRAGSAGTSISFADEEDSFYIPAIEELIGQKLPCIHPDEEWLAPLPPAEKQPAARPGGKRPQGPPTGRRPRSRPRRSRGEPRRTRSRREGPARERRPAEKRTGPRD
jgi:ATP-dependent RNA helicase RhlB